MKFPRLIEIRLVGANHAAQSCGVWSHRSLHAWEEAREVSRAAFRASRLYWRPHGSALFSQLQRAALSIQLNIAEGFALADRGRFSNHLAIAYGSAVESAELFEMGVLEELLPKEFAEEALLHCHRCERLLLGLLKRYRRLPRHR